MKRIFRSPFFHTGILLGPFALAAIAAGYIAPEAAAQPTDFDAFCQRYSENSRCENFVAVSSDISEAEILPTQAIRVQFDTIGSDREIVLIELTEKAMGEITLKAYHVEKTEGLLQTLADGIVGAVVPVPVPFDLIQVYDTNTSQTSFLAFTPDGCAGDPSTVIDPASEVAGCSIVGTDTIALSEEVDIRSGAFTLKYSEGNLVRALTFRIDDHDARFVSEIETDNLCEAYPLNSRCRYWPISQSVE
ncbi:MAG: hypothetical protein AAFR12_19295 [Cyanobacteria bacterium J06626_6]